VRGEVRPSPDRRISLLSGKQHLINPRKASLNDENINNIESLDQIWASQPAGGIPHAKNRAGSGLASEFDTCLFGRRLLRHFYAFRYACTQRYEVILFRI
jgi:hypothetical protein